MIDYSPLWETLTRKKLNRNSLKKNPGIASSTLAKLGKNEIVSLNIIDQICNELDCDISDVIKHVKE